MASLLHLLALSGAFLGHDVASLATDGVVHMLTEADFTASVRKFPYTFVEFYAPWCGHCKSLEPEWEKTATLARKLNVAVAKVDAIAEEKLAQTHGVQSFPTLFLFKGDPSVAVKYNGPRDASSMADWLGKWTEAQALAKLEATEEGMKAWSPSAKLKVLGLLSGEAAKDQVLVKLLEAASFMLNPSEPGADVPVAAAALPGGEIAKLGLTGVSLPCVALLRDFEFEDKTVVYEDYRESSQLFMSWLETKRAPALIPATRETEQLFLKDIQPGNAVAILFGSDQSAASEVHKLAVEMSSSLGKLRWVHAKQDAFGESLAKNVGLEASAFPEFVLWEFGEAEDDDRVFKLSQQEGQSSFPTKDVAAAVRSFVGKWQAGSLTVAKHRETTASAESAPIKSKAKASPAPTPPAKKTQVAKKSAKKSAGKGEFKKVPCPVDADIFACAKWCDDSSSENLKLSGTLGGKPCAESTPDDKPHDQTTCTCYDEDFTEAHLSCKSECVKARSQASKGGGSPRSSPQDDDKPHDTLLDEGQEEGESLPDDGQLDDATATCAVGDTSCRAGTTMTTTPYDEDDDIAADF